MPGKPPVPGKPPAAGEGAEPGPDAPEEPEPPAPPRKGTIRYQEPGQTVPRPPTLAEQRARQRAEDEERERERVALEQAERKSRVRRRVLIGGGVTVGVVAVLAVAYAAAKPKQMTAHCVSKDQVVVNEDYCDENYVRSHGGHVSGGFIFLPGPGGMTQYHYNYGGTGAVGQTVSGGSSVKPPGAEIKTPSGKSIQRGGFGVKGSSGS
ncbi:hypothetical protein [Streptoalloteichus hindustanus]|uniref:hypothetical protein n=1 Tax=Streptoalloteichus hindustanus TaxID=2017 RepID=UPI001F225CCF|nr:hypothetical protein [Streptoalloteichus hindustanus]